MGGGRLGDDDSDGTVEVAQIDGGGELGAFDATVTDFGTDRVGYGVAAAAERLFCFGGRAPQPRANATAALIETPPTLANNAWNNEGLSMTDARYLLGSSIQSAFIFLLGGETDNAGTVTDSTEWVVW